MNLTVAQFGVKLEELKKEVRKGTIDPHYGTLSEQGRLLLEQVIKFTPAKTEDQQRHALRNDLLNLFEIHREETVLAAVKKFGRGRINGWVNDNAKNVHQQISAAGVVLTLDEAKAVHRGNMTQRGRTKRLAKGFKYLIPFPLFVVYLDKQYLAIGKAKAGWLPAAARLFAKNIGQWILRHSPGQGEFIDGRGASRPFIAVRNFTRWASRADEGDRIINSAIASRIKAMDSYVRKQVELAAKRAGLDVKAA